MPYSVKGLFEINEDMVQILVMLEVLFTQDSKVEDLLCDASYGSEPSLFFSNYFLSQGWLGGAKVLGKLPVPGRPTILITVGQGSAALAVGAGGGCLDIFTLIYPFTSLSLSLWETARYRLKYCLKGPLNPKQPTNQYFLSLVFKPIQDDFQHDFARKTDEVDSSVVELQIAF